MHDTVEPPRARLPGLRDQSGEEPESSTPGRIRRRRSHVRAPWWFLIPGLGLYAFVVLYPTGRGFMYAFTDWDGISRSYKFIGFENFTTMWQDMDARHAVEHTLIIAVAITILQNGLGLLLALGVNSKIRSRNVLRVILFAPAVITPIVTAYLWQYMLSPTGAVNSFIGLIGPESWQPDWLGSPKLALWCIIWVVIWQFAGYSMVIFLAGLQSIPPDIYEAAALDGAGALGKFRYVTWPLLAPALTINLMLSIIGGIKLFDQVWGLTGGGPGHATDNLSTLLYKDAFTLGQFAYGIALAVVLTIIVTIVSSGQYYLLARNERAGS